MKVVCCAVSFLFLSLSLLGCNDQNTELVNSDSNESVVIDPLLPDLEVYSNIEDKYVVVLFGYGYNEGIKRDTLLAQLDDTYGLASNGGIVLPFFFPDDFVSFGYERISLLPDNISDVLEALVGSRDLTMVSTLVTIGAPDATHYALARLQDEHNSLRIFSLFSQDDVLGTEAGSTISIDYSISQTEQQEGYETLGELDLSYPGDVFNIVEPLINAGLDWNRIEKTGLFVPALRSEYAKKADCNFFVYIDPQTGLRSENHYVLTKREN